MNCPQSTRRRLESLANGQVSVLLSEMEKEIAYIESIMKQFPCLERALPEKVNFASGKLRTMLRSAEQIGIMINVQEEKLQQIQAATVRHFQIGQNQVGLVVFHHFQGHGVNFHYGFLYVPEGKDLVLRRSLYHLRHVGGSM